MSVWLLTSSDTRDVREKNWYVSIKSTILEAISITIQNRRNFFQENWVWNHLARILMCLVITSLSLGWTFLANFCWTTGILRELSWGGGPRLLGLGFGFGAMVDIVNISLSLLIHIWFKFYLALGFCEYSKVITESLHVRCHWHNTGILTPWSTHENWSK